MARIAAALIILLSLAGTALAVDANGYRRSATITTGQKSCNTTSSAVFSASSSRTGFTLVNSSGSTIYLTAGVDASFSTNGFALPAGASLSDGDVHPLTTTFYCAVSSGTATLTYITKGW